VKRVKWRSKKEREREGSKSSWSCACFGKWGDLSLSGWRGCGDVVEKRREKEPKRKASNPEVSRPPDAGCVGIDLDERGARSAPAVAATCRSLLLVSRRRSLAKERERIVPSSFSPSKSALFSTRNST
jgi:hypothetical protein